MKTASFRCIVVYVVWLVILIFGVSHSSYSGVIFHCDENGCYISSALLAEAFFGAAIFAFISYKIWQKLDPDPLWGDGESEVDDAVDTEYDSKVQAALKRKREQERVDDKEP